MNITSNGQGNYFLDHCLTSLSSWTVSPFWATLDHFRPLWPKILVSQHGSQNSVSNFFGTPCTSYCVIIIVPLFSSTADLIRTERVVYLANRKRFIRNSPRIPGILCFLSRLRQPKENTHSLSRKVLVPL